MRMAVLSPVNVMTEAHETFAAGIPLDGIPLDLALDVANIGVWRWEPDTGHMTFNRRLQALCGLGDAVGTLDSLLSRIHCEDRARVMTAMTEAATGSGPLKTECRVASRGTYTERWVLIEGCRYLAQDSGVRLTGTVRDVSNQKYAEAEHEIVVQEMEHRIRNVFAVVSAIVSLSERTADTSGQLAHALRRRIAALDRAYSSLSHAGGRACASLRQIIETELVAFADLSVATICGPPVLLHRDRAIAMHLIAHELTTNALKYGALSSPDGTIDISWNVDGSHLVLHWEESGPPGSSAPRGEGFGSRMMSLLARLNLGGDLVCDYRPDGARILLTVPVARLWQS
jgi:two-component system CheB/CheR fusion protein